MPIYRVPVRIDYKADGGPAFNVLHVRTVSSARDELIGALDAIEEFYQDARTVYRPDSTITLGEGMIKDPLGSPEYVNDDRRVVAGGGGGGTTPTLIAICVSWRTSSASRSGHGRTFLGPVQLSAVDAVDGTPTNEVLATVNSAAQGLVNSSSGLNDWAVGVLSTKQGLLRDITGFTVRDRFAFLSSRRPR